MPTETDTRETLQHSPGVPVASRDPFVGAATDDYDAIADLFLGGERPGAVTATAHARPAEHPTNTDRTAPRCDFLLLGHLPGAAAPWPAQYAAALSAKSGERVGIIKIDSGEITVDLVGEPALGNTAPTLDDALATLQRRAGRTLVVSNDTAALPVGPDRSHAATVLTGADEAAIVAAYRLIRSIAGSVGEVTLAVMGADDAAAERVHRQVRDAADGFLPNGLSAGPSVRRVGPISRVNLYRGDDPCSLGDLLAAISRPEPIKQNLASSPQRFDQVRRSVIDHPASTNVPPTPTPPPTPPPVSHASRITGLTPVESRCPYHENLELAADASGALAIVAVGGVESVAALLAAKVWAKDHARLLAKAEPTITNSSDEPTLHLMTDRPAAAIGLIGSGVRVHMLARADAEEWACLPLDSD